MNYTGILENDYANGSDVGVALFVAGCDLYCNNGECHGKDYYSFTCGQPFTEEVENKIINMFMEEPHYGRLTITGGNPTSQDNPVALLGFVQRFKTLFPNVKIWLYSGHTYEEIEYMDCAYELMKNCDILVDGRWQLKLHSLEIKFRGSSNQRIIDIKKTIEKNEIVILEEYI